MNVRGHDIGVCSWSLQDKSFKDLATHLKELGLSHLQLGLAGLVKLSDREVDMELSPLLDGGMNFTAGMISFYGEDYASIDTIRKTGGFASDTAWLLRKQSCASAAKLATKLGISKVSTHIGFVPKPGQPGYRVMRTRVREIAAVFAEQGTELIMETGQESATELREFLETLDSPNVGINFDPANMILYGAGDPIEAIGILAPYIRHVHIKDATASSKPGVAWGEEVPFGAGQVGAKRFLDAIDKIAYTGPLVIEREAGTQRLADVKVAIDVISKA